MRWEAIDTSGSPRRQPLPTCSQSSHEVRQRHSVRWCRWCDGRPSPHHAPLCLLATDYRSVPTIQYNTITSDVHSESEAQAVTRGEDAKAGLTEHTHTYTYPFDSPLSGTTRLSWYQTGKTNLYFTETRDSEWQWHQLGHMHVCTSLQIDNHASTPPLSFLQAGCRSCRSTNSVKAIQYNTITSNVHSESEAR